MKGMNHVKIGYLASAVLVLFYVCFRSTSVGITFDEAWTISDFVPLSIMDIFKYSPCDANNHIINTLLIKLGFFLGPDTLFIARLPNVLAFILYLSIAYKLSHRFLSRFVGFCCFLLLVVNPFVLDFFSLARGYGLALGFQLASIYYLINYIGQSKFISGLWSLVLGGLSVLSSFSFLYYWITLFGVVMCVSVVHSSGSNRRKTILGGLAVLIVLVLIMYEPIRKLHEGGNLYYGGQSGFYADTLVSLTKYSLYSPDVSNNVFIILNVSIVVFLVAVGLSYLFNRQKRSIKNTLVVTLVFSAISSVAQHVLFGTPYLLDRTAIYFYPLIVLTFSFSIHDLKPGRFFIPFLGLVVLVFVFNFFMRANFYKTATWYFDAHTEKILDHLEVVGKQRNKILKVDFSWPFDRSMRYYFDKNKYTLISLVKDKGDRDAFNEGSSHFIYLNRSLEKVGYHAQNQQIHSVEKETILKYEKEGVFVYEIKKHKE